MSQKLVSFWTAPRVTPLLLPPYRPVCGLFRDTPEVLVFRAGFNKLRMTAGSGDTSIFEHDNAVGAHNGLHFMSDDDNGFIPHDFADVL